VTLAGRPLVGPGPGIREASNNDVIGRAFLVLGQCEMRHSTAKDHTKRHRKFMALHCRRHGQTRCTPHAQRYGIAGHPATGVRCVPSHSSELRSDCRAVPIEEQTWSEWSQQSWLRDSSSPPRAPASPARPSRPRTRPR